MNIGEFLGAAGNVNHLTTLLQNVPIKTTNAHGALVPHMNSSDSPCSNTPKCANCSGDHVAYSFRCSQAKGSCQFQSSTAFSLAIMNEYKVSVCSFNINGTKDKVLSLDEKLANHDVVLLQEHLLPSCSVNFLKRSSQHAVFITNARRTRGRPFWWSCLYN